ncbi:Transcription factor [Penicillium paradoxum]|uniref:Transcription factor n=1 Tax=Penicillium paradoxum TaxID=176176 RepID=UPI002547AAFC|nr:Transcription factor [Penicillium paradoxum]KAJ5794114.1 Transcription factor [Penicillium paradoxum]
MDQWLLDNIELLFPCLPFLCCINPVFCLLEIQAIWHRPKPQRKFSRTSAYRIYGGVFKAVDFILHRRFLTVLRKMLPVSESRAPGSLQRTMCPLEDPAHPVSETSVPHLTTEMALHQPTMLNFRTQPPWTLNYLIQWGC